MPASWDIHAQRRGVSPWIPLVLSGCDRERIRGGACRLSLTQTSALSQEKEGMVPHFPVASAGDTSLKRPSAAAVITAARSPVA